MRSASGNSAHHTPATGGIRRTGYVQNRMKNFGLTMVVMGASFGLYYLGFFGGVEGPLQPGRIGERLAAMGFTGRHLLCLFLLLTLVAITWNWLYNAITRRPTTHAIRKGTLGHFAWIMFLIFSIIVFCHLP